MDFGFSPEQDMLRQTARAFLADNCPTSLVRQLMEDERGYKPELWKDMAELGWLGLAFPEEYGGQGLGFVDLTVILEEMGAVLLPSPFFASVLLAGQTLLIGGSEAQKKTYLPKIADGSLIATLALTEPSGRFDAEGITEVKATPTGDGFRISGTKLFVPDAHIADVMVVAARTKDSGDKSSGISLFLVEATSPGISTTLLKTMDQTRKQCEVVFDNVTVGHDRLIGMIDMGWPILQKVLNIATAALGEQGVAGAIEKNMAFASADECLVAFQHHPAVAESTGELAQGLRAIGLDVRGGALQQPRRFAGMGGHDTDGFCRG